MAAIRSFGKKITVGTALIGGTTDINPGGGSVTEIDATADDSESGYKEFIGGLKDGGSVEISGNYSATDVGQKFLRTNAGGTHTFSLVFSDGSKVSGSAVIGFYSATAPGDDAVKFTCPLRVSGPLTWEEA